MRKLIFIITMLSLTPVYAYDKITEFIGNPIYEEAAEFCSNAGKTKIQLDEEKIKALRLFKNDNLLDFLFYKRALNMRKCYSETIKRVENKNKISNEDWSFINYMIDMNRLHQTIDVNFKAFFEIDNTLQIDQPFRAGYIYDQVFKD